MTTFVITEEIYAKAVRDSSERCVMAEALRAAGWRDPKVMPNNEHKITVVDPQDVRRTYVFNESHYAITAHFDLGTPYADLPDHTFTLGRPILSAPVRKRTTKAKPRWDKGLSRAEAQERRRELRGVAPGFSRGRRSHYVKPAREVQP